MPGARLSNLQELFHLVPITTLTNTILEKKTEAQAVSSLPKATQLVHGEAMVRIWAIRHQCPFSCALCDMACKIPF